MLTTLYEEVLSQYNSTKFDSKENRRTFIRLFEMSMYGASDQNKATTFLNQLNATTTNSIITHMPKNK